MSHNRFNDIYINKMLKEIKENVEEKIDLSLKDCCDYNSEFLTRKIDCKMMELLKGILADDKKSTSVFKYNYWLFSDSKDLEQTRNDVKCRLILYYVALYFGEVDLLEKLILEGVSLGNNPKHLLLCALVPEIVSLFEEEEYISILKESGHVFEPFYGSISEIEGRERKNYLKKFASILKKKNMQGVDSIILSKKLLDIYSEEAYDAASLNQMNNVMCQIDELGNDENIQRINNLIINTNFSDAAALNMDQLFKYFTIRELDNFDSDEVNFYNKILEKCPEYLERARFLYLENPLLKECSLELRLVILKTMTDEEILALDEEIIGRMVCNSQYDNLYSEKDVADLGKFLADCNLKRKRIQRVKQLLLPFKK